ncbi:hypothetical protein Ddye_016260 [Dipteronia dyeriana]|uniref:Disease resistance R13L4/SHOC-2-like LRR domain-containing protein n=1 Tax=Dipteronia dyeriana TaxID=168575 RepID=A0AAD9U730_9ROSI|nr:hypothetical protein Ddye_016260 [Dipteronia dyeriana]
MKGYQWHVKEADDNLGGSRDRGGVLVKKGTESARRRNPIPEYPKVESWKLEGGNSSSADCCSWDGVNCDEETGHVIKLDLSSSCLSGSINSTTTLFHLVHLQWLSLSYNFFNFSEIPSTINNLSRLSHLNLSSSYISGQIPPQLLDLRNLVSLDLSRNYFFEAPGNQTHYLELRVPSLQNLVEKLTNLKVLKLDAVQISSPIPHILANLSSLTYLSLQDCGLRGEFPTKIFQLPNLSVLKLTDNSNLTGYLPEFERSSPLTVLAIGDCGFSGTIPSSLGNLTKLVSLDVSFSSFLGELPISIGNLASLKELNLEACNFSGQISSSLGNLTQLDYLDLSHSHNKFSGQNSASLSWIAKNSKLNILLLSDLNLVVFMNNTVANTNPQKFFSIGLRSCNLSNFPNFLRNQDLLQVLDLSSNSITGKIPGWFLNDSVPNLRYLNLSHNLFTEFSQHPNVRPPYIISLDVRYNKLEGPLPLILSKEMSEYLVSNNKLTGEIPQLICKSKYLYALDLSNNNLSGVLPQCLANLK